MEKELFVLFAEKEKLEIINHLSDKNFIIIKNCKFEKGAEYCKKFKASGMSCGKNSEDFQIGNFGKYN